MTATQWNSSSINVGSFTPIEGDDVDEIIEANGGLGEWEQPVEETTERWQFPRFPGADTLGQCDKHGGDNHQYTSECGDFDDFAVDVNNLYMSRTGIGSHDTDVETLVSWLAAPRNVVGGVCVLGEPGTGKTALIEAAATHAEANLVTMVATPDHTKDSLFLRFVGEGHGDVLDNGTQSPYTLGIIPDAVKQSQTRLTWLYIDEAMLFVDGVKPLLYPLTDGRGFLPEGNVDGSPLEIGDLRVIISSNPLVRGASLPEPLASRFASTTITVETTGSLLRDLDVDESVVAAWEAVKALGGWTPQIREVRMADYWLGVDPTQAASAFLPEHCPESQRKGIRDIVVGFIGGNLPVDGRLVVK